MKRLAALVVSAAAVWFGVHGVDVIRHPGAPGHSIVQPALPALDSPGAAGGQIPQNAQNLLAEIRANGGAAPPGYVGGGPFHNAEGLLPSRDRWGNPIMYREYDVNPYRQGVNRGTERIVMGNNGAAYYTSDHYQSFLPFP